MSFAMGLRIGMPRRGGAAQTQAPETPPAEPPVEPPTEPQTEPPQTAAPILSVDADGWQAVHADPGAFAPRTLAVARQGFDRSAQPASHVDALGLTKRVRAPYPDHDSLSADRVALSDFVYAGDVIEGVENRSERAAPKPVAMWLTPDMDRATGAQATVRLAVAHAHARNGTAVAAVRFTATDGTATAQTLVADTTVARYDASGLSIPCHEGTLDLSGLAQGVVTVDAVIYPWVGAPFRVSVDADAHPSPNLCPLRIVNDRAGGVGAAHARVETGGDDATGTAAADPSAAQPFATIPAAVAALRAFNAAAYGRDDAGGATVHLGAGTHVHASFRTQAGPTEIPLTITGAGAGQTVYRDAGASVSNGLPPRVVLRDLTLRKTGDRVVFLDSLAPDPSHLLRLERVTVDLDGQSDYAAWIYRVGRLQLLETVCENAAPRFFGTSVKGIWSVGSRLGNVTNLYAAAASRLARAPEPVPAGANAPVAGRFIGHCHVSGFANGQWGVSSAAPVGARGFALVGCVVEATQGDTGPALWLHADGNAEPCENMVVIANTVVGARTNLLYQDGGTVRVPKSGYLRFNVLRERNTKTDIFGRDGALTGNWSAVYNVAAAGNAAVRGASDGAGWGTGSWLGEIRGAGDVAGTAAEPLDPLWAMDASFDGTGAGGGDYTPGAALPAIPAGQSPFAADQMGRGVADDGTASAGALQPV